jgi:7-carboxy-7-deazaguanine synthase
VPESQIKLNEIFRSLQGESTLAGLPTVFVRLQGCNLRCTWCDTPGAREDGPARVIDATALVELVRRQRCRHVCITGGEPLLQREAVIILARELIASGHIVSLETNGSLPVAGLPAGLRRVVDLKPLSSGMADRNLPENLEQLGAGDELKCVVADEADFRWALGRVRAAGLDAGVPVLFSPVQGRLNPADLARWILDCGETVRLQLQLHRLIWPDGPEGVAIDA